MALWVCEGCTTKYAVGLSRCPRCLSTDFHEEGSMPKSTRHGGASNAAERNQTRTEVQGEHGPESVAFTSETKEVPSSPGSSSSASQQKRPKKRAQNATETQKPARTTESPSGLEATGGSSARSTGGGPTAPTSATDKGTGTASGRGD